MFIANRRDRCYTDTWQENRGSRITLKQLQEKSKDRNILTGRKLVSLAAKEYGYKGKDIAAYLQKDPSVITRYLKEGDSFKITSERVMKKLRYYRINVRVKEWRVTLGITLAVSTVSSFVPV